MWGRVRSRQARVPPQKGRTCGPKHEPCTIYHLTSALGILSANYFCINLGLAVGIIDALFVVPPPYTTLNRGKRILYGDKTIYLNGANMIES